jgi:hypothetical protein
MYTSLMISRKSWRKKRFMGGAGRARSRSGVVIFQEDLPFPPRSGGSTSDGERDHRQQRVKARQKAKGGVEHERQGACQHPRPLGFDRGVVHRYPVVSAGRPASWTSTR